MFRFLYLFIFFIPLSAKADKPWLCKYIDMEICNSSRYSRGSMGSYPGTSSAFRANPAAIPKDKGFGFEVITARGAYDYGIVTGTGKVGAVAVPSSLEDTFYSNMPIEFTNDYIDRKLEGRPYDSKKYAFGFATGLFPWKKQKSPISIDLGLVAKYNTQSKNFLPGAGLNLKMGPLVVGYGMNKDDFYDALDPIYQFKFDTTTFTASLMLPYVAFDYSKITNKLSALENFSFDDATIEIISFTLFWKKLMVTYGIREEVSYRPDIDYELGTWEFAQEKSETFLGIQYSLNDNIVLGLFSNYFLLNEWSLGMTVFF